MEFFAKFLELMERAVVALEGIRADYQYSQAGGEWELEDIES